MAKHWPGAIWQLRRMHNDPERSQGFVRTEDEKFIQIQYRWKVGHGWQTLSLPRADARLLARRIEQCLEATK